MGGLVYIVRSRMNDSGAIKHVDVKLLVCDGQRKQEPLARLRCENCVGLAHDGISNVTCAIRL